jgi:signal transduction histidine kinase/ActR/RegA family two-component response regulator
MIQSPRLRTAVLLLPITAIIVVTFLAYRAVERSRESNAWLLHTQEVLAALQTALATSVDAETGVRGYLVVGNSRYLEPFERAEASLDGILDRLATLTTDNGEQQRRIAELRTQVQSLRQSLTVMINVKRAGGSIDGEMNDREKSNMDAVRGNLTAIRAGELALLSDRTSSDAAAIRHIYWMGLGIVGIAVGCLAWVYVLLANDAKHRLALASEQRARQETEEASRLKDEFLMTVSHELRTPLTAIQGWARMLSTGEVREDQRARALEVIERNARAQTQLVNDLLDASRAITGKLHLELTMVEMPEIVLAAVDSVRPTADAKRIRIDTRIDPHPGAVSGDAARLQQVVWNLLTNAVKFTSQGGRVEVRVSRIDSFVEVAVSDTGPGISAAFLPHVFERFRQEQSGTTRAHSGLGLGLAIVRHLTELHGGTVSAESGGQAPGATFRVRVPVAAVRDVGVAEPGLDEPAPELQRLDHVRVLIVDDEPQAHEMFGAVLQRAGARVSNAASPAEAMLLLQEELPEVLLSDIEMPGEDGYTFVRKARAIDDSQGGRLLAVAVSAHGRPEDRRRAVEAGFDWHLAKPVDPFELVATIASLVSRNAPRPA